MNVCATTRLPYPGLVDWDFCRILLLGNKKVWRSWRGCICGYLVSGVLLLNIAEIKKPQLTTAEQVRAVLERDVLKRDVLEGDKAVEAHRKVSRAIAKAAKHKADAQVALAEPSEAPVETAAQAATAKG